MRKIATRRTRRFMSVLAFVMAGVALATCESVGGGQHVAELRGGANERFKFRGPFHRSRMGGCTPQFPVGSCNRALRSCRIGSFVAGRTSDEVRSRGGYTRRIRCGTLRQGKALSGRRRRNHCEAICTRSVGSRRARIRGRSPTPRIELRPVFHSFSLPTVGSRHANAICSLHRLLSVCRG